MYSYQNGDPGTVGVLSTPLLLYHVEQLILGNIEVEILKEWVARKGREEKQDRNETSVNEIGGSTDSDNQHPAT
jgi:sodium/bile acid cotransporter 7